MDKVENPTHVFSDESKFVTNVAWIFIVLTGFSTLISILQNIMITLMVPANEIKGALNKPGVAEHMPVMARFMFSHIQLFFFGFFVVSAIMLVSSIGLLKRKNWARLVFITILVLGIIWNVSSLFLQSAIMPKMPTEVMQQQGAKNLQIIFEIMRVFTAIMAIGMSVLFAWIIKKLVSLNIKQEFVQTKGAV